MQMYRVVPQTKRVNVWKDKGTDIFNCLHIYLYTQEVPGLLRSNLSIC